MAIVTISPRGEARVRHGHPWIYRSDVAHTEAQGGEVVRVVGAHQRPLGHAFFSDQSQIALRMVTRDDRPVDEASGAAVWRRRSPSAIGSPSTPRRGGWSTARAIWSRRSSSIAMPTCW